ncbi:MAG TPA: rhodanese-like domain-containing protein, partial [Jatrophihabitans sp.]|nr:rhodanese-like domain-containing protein [Jatrophihabitans sp.]
MTVEPGRALIGVDELAGAVRGATPPVLLDVRWQVGLPPQRADYLAAHIPGARWCDLDADLADPPGAAGRHPLPDPARLQAAVRRWGIRQDSWIVTYDGAAGVAAARAWWVLRWAGLSRVTVLDGGLAAWQAAGHPIESAEPSPDPGDAVVQPDSVPVLDAGEAAALAAAGRLVDVRAPERFLGEHEPIDPVAGHIPGAVNLPSTGNVDGSGHFLGPEELRRRFAALHQDGTTPTDGAVPIGLYCGSGVTAAHTALALAHA